MRKWIYVLIGLLVGVGATVGVVIALRGGEEVAKNKVKWETDRVSLEADHFYIVADGQTFYANTSPDSEFPFVGSVEVHSDPGSATYCTLEISWRESGVEMRLYMYFRADGQDWWSNEIRTYNGEEDGNWIYYYGEFFRSSLGTAFTGDVDLQSSSNGVGKLYFDNLKIQAFLGQ